MASYSADFQWKSSRNEEEISSFLGDIYFANKHLDTGEMGYDITTLINGVWIEGKEHAKLHQMLRKQKEEK